MLLIENPEFCTMRGMWNQVLDSLLRRMTEGGYSQGSVTLKLTRSKNGSRDSGRQKAGKSSDI